MKKKILIIFIFILFPIKIWTAEITSLSHVFLIGYGIQDTDRDGLGDKVSLKIIIPDNPTPYEIAASSDIAARANFDSLVVDFSLVKSESKINGIKSLKNPILIGNNLNFIKKLKREGKISPYSLNHHEGLVSTFSYDNQKGIAIVAGSQEVLLKTSRAFFLRWPYLWEIWGRKEGETYFTVEDDLRGLFGEKGIKFENIAIKTAIYEFLPKKSSRESIKRLNFNQGEIKNLIVEIDFPDSNQQNLALEALKELKNQHRKGLKTDFLSYSGCALLSFDLQSDVKTDTVSLERMGYPKRILTPSYKTPFKQKISGKDFDLLNLFSSKALYSDSNKDHILDKLDTSIIIPEQSGIKETALLASRLILPTAGASFPIVYTEDEIENKKNLVSPILIGSNNSLIKELTKTGKLKLPDLKEGWGIANIVSHAFNKSNALVVVGKDKECTGKTLAYLSKNFPYFDEYKEGTPQFKDAVSNFEEFFNGERGSAEAYFYMKLKKFIKDNKDKVFENLNVEICLPEKNPLYNHSLKELLENSLEVENLQIKIASVKDNKNIFIKEKQFSWEGEEVLKIIQENINSLEGTTQPVKISLGVSESPEVREKIKGKIKDVLIKKNILTFDIDVLSSYKQGFFWLKEKMIPELKEKNASHLIVKVAEEKEDFRKIKRFYSEQSRWLKELYPVDEIISEETGIPLEKIEFEIKKESNPVYEVYAYDKKNKLVFQDSFSPFTKEALYLNVLPEWGNVKRTSGWLKIENGEKTVLFTRIKSDLEKFWEYYQTEILPEVYSFVLQKTENRPSFSKQPYFKRLKIEMWFSEPDFKLGKDEEIVSSLEAMHDEIYFDTLDFLRGITEIEPEDEKIPEDSSRYSAPGNILPLIHPSVDGKKGEVKIVFDDWKARSPNLVLKWKEHGEKEYNKKITFPFIKVQNIRIPSFIYDGSEGKIQNILIEVKIEKEDDYLALLDIINSYRELKKQGVLPPAFCFPKLNYLTLKIRYKELLKEESFPVSWSFPEEKTSFQLPKPGEDIVPTEKIISPPKCLEIVQTLSNFKIIKSYYAGKSYENRKIPIMEIFSPQEKYISLPRLITFKPTLYISGRQHANEVSSTNYILKFAELLAKEKSYMEYIKRINFVLHPMENPDGAELAYELQKITPFHSLHAGRYSSLGIDVGHQVNVSKPLLPEAKVRKQLYNRWLPDIYLNLHGYPSHEWVQQFSNYSPYLFRDYWIPRGWFAYYNSISLPIYEKWNKAGDELKSFIIKELNANTKISKSNKKFYDRYFRWAARWEPHMNRLEIYNGLNLYAKRRSSRENKLTERRRTTFVEETPELMDETAHGQWLDFLCKQGLAYLRAHVKYLSQVKLKTARVEEEIHDRIHIQFFRSRPGKLKKNLTQEPQY